MKYKHLFGPVQSRRLGISLGVDVVPCKYCPLDCVYCEVYETTNLTQERTDFFPVIEITDELDALLADNPKLDYITFSGAGEPTLYEHIGAVCTYIRTHFPQYKLALITNSVLLGNPGLLSEIKDCDLILPSLDAVSQPVFEQINRPAAGISAKSIVNGLIALRSVFSGQMWLETFIIPGLNDNESELSLIRDAVRQIKPDRLQINTLDRPGTEDWVRPASSESLESIRDFFQKALTYPVDIIANTHYNPAKQSVDAANAALVKAALQQKPCTMHELVEQLNLHVNEVNKVIRQFLLEGHITAQQNDQRSEYAWKD